MSDVISQPPIIDAEFTEELWKEKSPQMGDHIRVKRIGGLYAHHGVYVSDDEVIHFTGQDDDSILDWSKCSVIKSDLQTFLKGGTLEVKAYTDEEFQDLYSPEQIVSYARSCIGDTGYNLALNNCEHFANVCTLGRFRSQQVERVLMGKLPNEEDKNMGLLGKIGGAIRSLFGGSSGGGSRSTTTYEPDKVKAAEIEADTKVKLAHMENDRIELMKQARIDILQYETESQIALEEAKAKGFTVMAQTIVMMQEKLNEIAEKRLLIIEKASLPIIKDIETFYGELSDKIQDDNEKYSTEKLPKLLDILNQYEEGSPAHKLYSKRVEEDMNMQLTHFSMQIEAIQKRQQQIIDGFLESKDKVLEQTGQLTAGMLEAIQQQKLELKTTQSSNSDNMALPNKQSTTMLEDKQS